MFTQVVIAAMPPEVENALSLTEFAMAKHGTHHQQLQAGMFRAQTSLPTQPANS